MKKILISTVIFVLLLAASVFAFTKSGATNESSCPMQQMAQTTDADYSNVVVARGDSCCQPGADCCKGGSCCKHKRK